MTIIKRWGIYIPECKYPLNICFTICQNKHIRYVLGVLHWLVSEGVFKKCKLNFLPKGHTHNDCDQMFSCFSDALKIEDIITVEDIHRICASAYTPAPLMIHLDNFASISSLLKPLLPAKMHGHSKPRSFVVRRDRDGIVRHHYRMQNQTSKKDNIDCWMPCNGPGYRLLNTLPDESKLRMVPYKPADIIELKDTMKSLYDYCTLEQRAWWQNIIDEFEEQDLATCETCKALRVTMQENGRSKHDDKTQAREKGRKYRAAYKELFQHMEDPSMDASHRLFGSIMPKQEYVWDTESKSYKEPDMRADLNKEDVTFIDKLSSLQAEGTPCHFVDNLASSKRDAKRSKNIEVCLSFLL